MICDVGGQDIKIIILKNGRVKDFKLNTQCSAGNGYFLQSTAQGFGVPVEEYADIGLRRRRLCRSSATAARCSCSRDIVDFQRQGWKPEEIMAGLCNVLPKNIWLYVSQIPNLSAIGHALPAAGRHAVQPGGGEGAGGLHRVALQGQGRRGRTSSCTSTAARRAPSARRSKPGACGTTAAQTTFIGLDAVRDITYKTTRDEATRCYFCKNKCLRTFIDVKTSMIDRIDKPPREDRRCRSKPARSALIIATCEKGTVEDVDEMRKIKGDLDTIKEANPNFVEIAAKAVFRVPDAPNVSDPPPRFQLTAAAEAARRADEEARRRSASACRGC